MVDSPMKGICIIYGAIRLIYHFASSTESLRFFFERRNYRREISIASVYHTYVFHINEGNADCARFNFD